MSIQKLMLMVLCGIFLWSVPVQAQKAALSQAKKISMQGQVAKTKKQRVRKQAKFSKAELPSSSKIKNQRLQTSKGPKQLGKAPKKLTLEERNALATPLKGTMIYQTNHTEGYYYYDGTTWVSFKPSSKEGQEDGKKTKSMKATPKKTSKIKTKG